MNGQVDNTTLLLHVQRSGDSESPRRRTDPLLEWGPHIGKLDLVRPLPALRLSLTTGLIPPLCTVLIASPVA
jgi:hypothetical protein